MDLTVSKVERFWVDVPFRDIPAKHMVRELPHWTLFEVCEVHLACGVVGFGETMCYYTWGTVSDESAASVIGKKAPECMWDDGLGAGLQMALFDAVGKALEVPCWALMGAKHRDAAFVSWWDIDMPGEDWLTECRTAMAQGYTSFKTKARPWFDLGRQVRTLNEGLPAWFDLDLDFNGMLIDTAHAGRVLTSVDHLPNVAIFETPIPQADVAGMRTLRRMTHIPFAMHYGQPPIPTALAEDVCDGFVVGGGVSTVLANGALLAQMNKPFWLQLVGTEITATFSLHLAAVLSHARWPAVNCHQLYREAIVRRRMSVANGLASVPDGPGLGLELDREAIERLRIEPKAKPYPEPNLLIAIRWPSGATSYYAHTQQYWDDFLGGRLPVFPDGVYLEMLPDDGTPEWKELQRRARDGGVHTGTGVAG